MKKNLFQVAAVIACIIICVFACGKLGAQEVNKDTVITLPTGNLVPYAKIENKVFVGYNFYFTQKGFQAPYISNCTFIRCNLYFNTCNGLYIANNYFSNCDNALRFDFVLNSNINYNRFQSCGYGIYMDTLAKMSQACNMNTFIGNRFHDTKKCAIYDNNGVGNTYINPIIEGNNNKAQYLIYLNSMGSFDKMNTILYPYFEQACDSAMVYVMQKSDVTTNVIYPVVMKSGTSYKKNLGTFNWIKK
jgi:hypothetical protein